MKQKGEYMFPKLPLKKLVAKNRLINRAIVISLAISMIPLFLTLTSAQPPRDSKEKKIVKLEFKREPIEISEVRSKGTKIKFDTVFSSDDWFSDLTIKFKNVSKKPITYIDFNFVFPETAATGIKLADSLYYGVPPLKGLPMSPKLLNTGETDEVVYDPPKLAHLKAFVGQRRDLGDLTEANLSIQLVYFADGTHWSAGDYYRPDPTRPGKFVVDNSEYPER
jgi:hypothetical protein